MRAYSQAFVYDMTRPISSPARKMTIHKYQNINIKIFKNKKHTKITTYKNIARYTKHKIKQKYTNIHKNMQTHMKTHKIYKYTKI